MINDTKPKLLALFFCMYEVQKPIGPYNESHKIDIKRNQHNAILVVHAMNKYTASVMR